MAAARHSPVAVVALACDSVTAVESEAAALRPISRRRRPSESRKQTTQRLIWRAAALINFGGLFAPMSNMREEAD